MFFVSTLAAAAVTAAVLAQDPRPATRPAPSAVEGPPAEHQDHRAHEHAGSPASGTMPLLKGLGTWHHRISTTSPDAQRYFDQGLRLTYGFNHDEAVRSFERAACSSTRTARCVTGASPTRSVRTSICRWMPKTEPRALEAIRPRGGSEGARDAGERALIEAMAVRYGEPAGAARAERDAAYADAMRQRRRDVSRPTSTPRRCSPTRCSICARGTSGRATASRSRARSNWSARSSARWRASRITPARATSTSTRSKRPRRPSARCRARNGCPRSCPAPATWSTCPRTSICASAGTKTAARANIAAVEADNRYFAAHAAKPGVYPMFYAPHNLHFLWSAYLLSGQREKALNAARALAERVKLDDARATPSLEVFLPPAILTLARFGQWDAVLAEPAPPAELRYATGLWHYARGLAFAARKDSPSAEGELKRVRALSTELKDDMIIVLNPAPALLKLAAEVLAGRDRRGRAAVRCRRSRISARRQAMEDALTYDEPPRLVPLGAQPAGRDAARGRAGRRKPPRHSVTTCAISARPAGRSPGWSARCGRRARPREADDAARAVQGGVEVRGCTRSPRRSVRDEAPVRHAITFDQFRLSEAGGRAP